MKTKFGIALVVGIFLALYFWPLPDKPTHVIPATVVALESVDGTDGLRRITVKLETGEERVIETLAPFFLREGFPVKVGVYERPLFFHHYDIVAFE